MGAMDDAADALRVYAYQITRIRSVIETVRSSARGDRAAFQATIGGCDHPRYAQTIHLMLEAERRLAEAIEELAGMIAKSGELLVDIQGGAGAEASAGGDLGAGPPGSPPGAVRVEPAARAGGDADAGLGDGSRGGTGKPHTVVGFDPRPCLDQLPVFSRDRRGRTKT
ncbi:MAG: hypothetical protein KJO75_19455, partial [Dactylosporangium sp.]|nr:hypothetical protein [Dactylosporangium sp.]